jgi:hypothetical protein
MFKVSPASLQTFIDTPNCVLEDGVQYSTVHIPNVFCDGHLQVINTFTCILYCSHREHRDFLSPCISASTMVINQHNYRVVSIYAFAFEDSRLETSPSDRLCSRLQAANTPIPRCTRIILHSFANSRDRTENQNILLVTF